MTHADLWREMKKRAWSPEQWFLDGDSPLKTSALDGRGNSGGLPAHPSTVNAEELTIMWVYRATEGLFEVGWWSPERQWNLDTTWGTRDDAARRVHWLNGGGGSVKNVV